MTCIVGLEHEGQVWLGGDSAAVADTDISIPIEPKVFRNGPYVIGFSTSFRMGQILQYQFRPPNPAKSRIKDLTRFMITQFIEAVREAFKDKNFKDEDGDGGQFLVGYRNKLFIVDSDFHICRPAFGFHAIGCGDNPALGALFVSQERTPMDRVMGALKASAAFCTTVRGPFTVIHT
jgi:ATP-dependent protease HslVU (ClpYQ) peptidase subunit